MSWVDDIHLNPAHTILSFIVIFGRIQVNMEKTDKQMCIGGKKKKKLGTLQQTEQGAYFLGAPKRLKHPTIQPQVITQQSSSGKHSRLVLL